MVVNAWEDGFLLLVSIWNSCDSNADMHLKMCSWQAAVLVWFISKGEVYCCGGEWCLPRHS